MKKINDMECNIREGIFMEKWKCPVCGYVYDATLGIPDNGIDPGTSLEQLPDDWVCPLCGVPKEDFKKE
jgi:rubredoxin